MGFVHLIYFNGVLAYIANSILIFFILRHSRADLGTYRYLMVLFAVFNLIYPTVHMVVMPNMHVYGRAFILFPSSIMEHMLEPGHWGMVVYGSLFCGSCALLAYHFLYRYCLLCKNHWMFLFNEKKYAPLLLFGWCAMVVIWGVALHLTMYHTEEYKNYVRGIMMSEYQVDVDKTPILGLLYVTNSTLGEDIWSLRSFYGFMVCMTELSGTFGVICFCIAKIYQTLNGSSMSHKAKKLQFDLLKALIYQTIIPVLFEYMPCALTYFTPLLNIPFGRGCNYVPIAISFYPVLDPICILYFIKDYRYAIMRKLRIPTTGASSTGVTSIYETSKNKTFPLETK